MTYHYAYGRLLPKILLKIGILSVTAYFFCGLAVVSAQQGRDSIPAVVLTGSVVDTAGVPIAGATVAVRGINASARTDRDGRFSLRAPYATGTLTISYIGHEPVEASFDSTNSGPFRFTLSTSRNALDEVQVIGYGQVSRRFNTGSVVTVTAEELERQPVSNPLAALAGRVPGMTVEQSNGNPGAKVNIQIRGQNSIAQGSEPLFLIDGVPYPNNSIGVAVLNQANGGHSPFTNINPSDIASIDVLKDADATAIYGSRGANGVVLITTKRGHAGSSRIQLASSYGLGRVKNRLDLLGTEQYLEMRHEAFANDGITPTAVNAPDLVLWDQARYTDWQEYLWGGTAAFVNSNLSFSGGNAQTRYSVSGNYHKQGNIYAGRYADDRGTMAFNLSQTSADERFRAILSSSLGRDVNRIPGNPMATAIFLPPNNPALLDADGELVWAENGGTFNNPLTYLKRKTEDETNRVLANMNVQYELFSGLALRITGGYHFLQYAQLNTNPSYAQNPASSNLVPSADFATTNSSGWIVEPQLEYHAALGKGQLNALVGTTVQQDNRRLQHLEASDFSNDALIEAVAFAGSLTARTSRTDYRYQALFGRFNYNHAGKYLINLTGRRDGSSRFGPNRRVANFGAVGIGWIFSEETALKTQSAWLSFGKVRASYGMSGNDQIGDYQYLDNYAATMTAYQGKIGYIPSRLFNADYTWERNKKLEVGLEMGLFDNILLITVNRFRNRSDSQLINYRLPDQTGFSSIFRNFGATVANTGWEFMLTGTPVRSAKLTWAFSLNATTARNELIDFPGLAASSYAHTLVIGQPVTIGKFLHYQGVDPETGLYTFAGTARPQDQTVMADFTPRYYGGLNNSLRHGNWELNFLFQFTRQRGNNGFATFSGNAAPGTRNNQLAEVMAWRWRTPGDEATIQRFTSGTGVASVANNNLMFSDAPIGDASFIRLKNVYLSYALRGPFRQASGMHKELRVFVQGQNLFTVTGYPGMDPETGVATLPPLQQATIGFSLTL